MATKVSIIEDDRETRRAFETIFNGTPGYTCLSAHPNAEDALEHLPVKQADVVLVDISLPEMSGIDCVRQLKQLRPSLPVMMFTVYEDTERIFQSLLAGANGYVLKRTPPAELLEAISDLLAGGAPMSRSIAAKVLRFFHNLPRPAAELAQLTPREREILEHISRGRGYKEVAAALKISTETVRSYLRRICDKLHVTSRTEAVAKYNKGAGPAC